MRVRPSLLSPYVVVEFEGRVVDSTSFELSARSVTSDVDAGYHTYTFRPLAEKPDSVNWTWGWR